MKNNLNIAIIGYGRFGELLAKILSPFGNIFVISSKPVRKIKFKKIEITDLPQMDWVIPAVPISALKDTLRKIAPHLKKGVLVTDVCSVKFYPCKWLKKYLPSDIEITGTHPMFGPDSAKNGLKDLQIVVCPLRQSEKTLIYLEKIFSKMGLEIIKTTPEFHDKEVAKCLALVHFIGRGLEKIKVKKQKITTLGFERLLRVNETVSNDTWQLFLDISRFNPYTSKVRKDFIQALRSIDSEIRRQHLENLSKRFGPFRLTPAGLHKKGQRI